MSIIFGNPSGFFALLGIPAVLLIHTLQARSRHTVASTLFLLEHLAPESKGGWHFERIRNSVPLILQILAVAVLTWVLTAPRWVREDSTQQIVVVLDSSFSMEVSLEKIRSTLPGRLKTLEKFAAKTEWTLLESDTRATTIYRGENLGALETALQKWHPSLGAHDIAPALQIASSIVRGAGTVIFVTDHPAEMPGGAAILSFSTAKNNTGFIGSSLEKKENDTVWRAMVRNHGKAPKTLEYRLERTDGTGISAAQNLALAAGETRVIGGIFPQNETALLVKLSGDEFALDDALPLLKPASKNIRVFLNIDGGERRVLERVLQGLDGISLVENHDDADLVALRMTPDYETVCGKKSAIIFPQKNDTGEPLNGWIICEKNALVNDTAWQGLLCANAAGIRPTANDTALLWRGKTPLISLRQLSPRPAPPALLFNFQPAQTNVSRLPAFVILLRRYIEEARATLPVPFALNADTRQHIPVAFDATKGAIFLRENSGEMTPLTSAQVAVFRAPARPGFFQILQNDAVLVNGTAQFSDVREADLSICAPADTLAARANAMAHAASTPDPYRVFWLMLLPALPLAAWVCGRNRG